MNAGPSNLIDFLQQSWIDGEYQMLFNRTSQVDHQRRAFSHSKKRMDVFSEDEPVETPHADQMRRLAKSDYLKDNGPFTLPMTAEKITEIKRIFEEAAKDITEDPKWQVLWDKTWMDKFCAEAAKNPQNYLTPSELERYQQIPTDSPVQQQQFIETLAYPHRKEVMSRVTGAYAFKMLTELLMKREIEKDICGVLQTVVNHMDHFTSEQMMDYLNDNAEKELMSQIIQVKEGFFHEIRTKLSLEDTAQSDTEITTYLQAHMAEKLTELKDSPHFKKLPQDRQEALIAEHFGVTKDDSSLIFGQAIQNQIKDFIETKFFWESHVKSINLDTMEDPLLKEELTLLKSLVSKNEIGYVQIAFEASDLTDPQKVSRIVAEAELQLADIHFNKNLDHWIQGVTHGTREKDSLDDYFDQIMRTDTVHGDTACVQHRTRQKLEAIKPEIDELIRLRQAMEAHFDDPQATKGYYEKLNEVQKMPNFEEALLMDSVKQKWKHQIATITGPQIDDFKEKAQALFDDNPPPVSQDKVSALYRALKILEEDLLNAEGFKDDMASLPSSEQEAAKRSLLHALRKQVIESSTFVVAGENLDNQDAIMKNQMYHSYLQKINDALEHGKSEVSAYQDLTTTYRNTLETQVNSGISSIRDKISSGKTLSEAVDLINADLERITTSACYEYSSPEERDPMIQRMEDLKNDYLQLKELIDTEMLSIASQFVPTEIGHSGARVVELINQSIDKIKDSPVFEKLPNVGPTVLKRYLESDEALDKIFKEVAEKRTAHFGKYLNDFAKGEPVDLNNRKKDGQSSLDTLINDKKLGLKWIRNYRARREVISRLSESITQGGDFEQRNAFSKFFGIQLTKRQQQAKKSLQEEFLYAVKADLASMNREEGLMLLNRIKDKPILKAIPRASFGELFTKKDVSVKRELQQLAKIVEKLPEEKPLKEVSLLSAYTSPEEDIAFGLLNRMSVVMESPELLSSSSPQLQERLQEDQLLKMLSKPEFHQVLRMDLEAIKPPKERIKKVEELFAMAHKNDLFDYHSHFHIKHQQYAPAQKQAIALLQDLYIQAIKEETHYLAWEACGEDPTTKSPEQWPEELSIEEKNDIYFNHLAKAKKEPIMHANIRPDGAKALQQEISIMVDQLNDIPDTGASKDIKEFLAQEAVRRKMAKQEQAPEPEQDRPKKARIR